LVFPRRKQHYIAIFLGANQIRNISDKQPHVF